ncbi:hypothetical protein B0A50_05534 [Salinomyces thailandicus]|uniref:Uncharacterized protein n=1 Tax=Salinomyces thailandicus TaxID=706561 RepID=A0A4U0TVJ1_9PEZI|nr:hypothetical protein B0A50_05534 [Salinomyces thailandica]
MVKWLKHVTGAYGTKTPASKAKAERVASDPESDADTNTTRAACLFYKTPKGATQKKLKVVVIKTKDNDEGTTPTGGAAKSGIKGGAVEAES